MRRQHPLHQRPSGRRHRPTLRAHVHAITRAHHRLDHDDVTIHDDTVTRAQISRQHDLDVLRTLTPSRRRRRGVGVDVHQGASFFSICFVAFSSSFMPSIMPARRVSMPVTM